MCGGGKGGGRVGPLSPGRDGNQRYPASFVGVELR